MNGLNSQWTMTVVSVVMLLGVNLLIGSAISSIATDARNRLDVLEERFEAVERRMDLIDKVIEFQTKEGKQQ